MRSAAVNQSLAFAVVLLATALVGPTPSPALLVLSKSDHVLSIVDPTTLAVVAQIPSGPDPHEVEASADGTLAFISNYGSGAYNTITVVDLVKQRALQTIDLGALRGPHGLMFAAGKLWFTAEAAKAIGSYDPSTQRSTWYSAPGRIAHTCCSSHQMRSES